MPSAGLLTYQEVIDHLTDFVEGDPSAAVERDARRSVQEGLRDLANRHAWQIYYGTGRIHTVAPQTEGTVTYLHTSGEWPHELALDGATWPDWATFGYVVIENVRYEVAEILTPTVLTLTHASNPGVDILTPTNYSLRRDQYPLPTDFVSADEFINVNQTLAMKYQHPRWWLQRQRIVVSPSFPTIYTFMGDPNYQGALAAAFYPPPDAVYALDYLYKRRARPLEIASYHLGKCNLAGNTALVTGVGTHWLDRHVGCIFRVLDSSVDIPTGRSGANPYLYERVVAARVSGTEITLDAIIPDALSNVRYELSDPIDIEVGTMGNAFLACCEYWMATARHMKDRSEIEQRWLRELERAQEGDSRSLARRVAGEDRGYGTRLAHMPMGPDLE